MPAINVAPTRTNLIRIRKELRFAREGYEILDRKRQVLTTELVRVAHEADVLRVTRDRGKKASTTSEDPRPARDA